MTAASDSAAPDTRSDLTALLVARVRHVLESPTTADFELARQCLVDWSGVLLAAVETPYRTSQHGWSAVAAHGGATDLVHGVVTAPSAAAATNGMFSHVLDFDDVHLDVPGHTGVATIPAALAAAESADLGLDALCRGIIAGVEAMAWLGRLMAPGHHAAGWHPTATLGAVGAGVAAAVALGLDDAALRSVIGLSALQASGLQQAFGTEGKSWQVGCASRNGVDAVNAVRAGLSCDADMLGGARGLVAVYGGPADADQALADAAAPQRAAIHDTIFKMHASCFTTHSVIEAAQRLRDEHGVRAEDIEEYSVRVGAGFASVVAHRAPSTGLLAKFSATTTAIMPFIGISTVVPESFTDDLVADSSLMDLERRGRFASDPAVSDNGAVLSLQLRDGAVLTAAADCPAPSDDLTEQSRRIDEKFRQLTGTSRSAAAVEAFLSHMRQGDDVSVRALISALGEIRRGMPRQGER